MAEKVDEPYVVCVDDESGILRSIKRLLHAKPYKLISFESVGDALNFMSTQEVALVVSDMKMPGVSGADFLAEVAKQFPQTYRIAMSGYSDLENTIAAINKGRIHRFIQKPWENEDFVSMLDECLNLALKDKKLARLQSLVEQQNQQLSELNKSLEEKVALRTKQIKAALNNITFNQHALEKVLYNTINLHPNIDGEFGIKVQKLNKKLCKLLELKEDHTKPIVLAGLLVDMGLMTIEEPLFEKPFLELNYEQQKAFMQQVEHISLILSQAQHLQPVAQILMQQFEQVKGNGYPSNLSDTEICIGAKIIAITRDFCRYSEGRMTSQRWERDAIIVEMKKSAGIKYDADIFKVFEVNRERILREEETNVLLSKQLEAGMTLLQDLFTPNHVLLLSEGHVFSESTIKKLQQFEQSQGVELRLSVAQK